MHVVIIDATVVQVTGGSGVRAAVRRITDGLTPVARRRRNPATVSLDDEKSDILVIIPTKTMCKNEQNDKSMLLRFCT